MATCRRRSSPDPHGSCRPALLVLISSQLQGTYLIAAFFLGLSVPAGSPRFSLPLPDGIQEGLYASSKLLQPHWGTARHRSPCKHIYEAAKLGVVTEGTPRNTRLVNLMMSRTEGCYRPSTTAVLARHLHDQGCCCRGHFLPVYFLPFPSSLTRPSGRLTAQGAGEPGAWR